MISSAIEKTKLADELMTDRDDPYDVEKCVQWIQAKALKQVEEIILNISLINLLILKYQSIFLNDLTFFFLFFLYHFFFTNLYSKLGYVFM